MDHPVENRMDLDRTSVLLVDELTASHLFIAKNGQIGRSPGAYPFVKEKLLEVLRAADAEREDEPPRPHPTPMPSGGVPAH